MMHGPVCAIHIRLAWSNAVCSIVSLRGLPHGRRPVSRRHCVLGWHARAHTVQSIVHYAGRLRCHCLRSSWRRRPSEYVVESGVPVTIGRATIARASGSMVARLGATIVCHAQSRDSRRRTALEGGICHRRCIERNWVELAGALLGS